jgi:hypothetical protein
MPTLTVPSLEGRLLTWINELTVSTPTEDSLRWAADLIAQLREYTTETRLFIEAKLSDGSEARSVLREIEPIHLELVNAAERIGTLTQSLQEEGKPATKSLLEELHGLEREQQQLIAFLNETIALAAQAPRPVDWKRIQAAEDAYRRGETKACSRS